MNQNYNVDDILAEIKRKKSVRETDSPIATTGTDSQLNTRGPQVAYEEGPSYQDFRNIPPRRPVEEVAPVPERPKEPVQQVPIRLVDDPAPAPKPRTVVRDGPVPISLREEEPQPTRPNFEDAADYTPPEMTERRGFSPPGQRRMGRNIAANFGKTGSLVPPEDAADESPDFARNFSRAKAAKQMGGGPQPQEQQTVQRPLPIGRMMQQEDGWSAQNGNTTQARVSPFGEEEPSPRHTTRFDFPEIAPDEITPKEAGAKEDEYIGDYQDQQQDADQSRFIDDYHRPADAVAIRRDLQSQKLSLFIRLFVTAICFGVLLYLAFALTNISLNLPPFMMPEKDMNQFMAVNVVVLLIAMVLNGNTVVGGLLGIFKKQAAGDTPIAIASWAALIQGTILIFKPEQVTATGVHYYLVVACLGLWFNTLGKLFMIFRIQNNFKVISSPKEKHALATIKNRELIRELFRGMGFDSPVVAYSVPTEFVTDFLDSSYQEDFGENFTRIATLVFLLASLVLSGVSFLIAGSIDIALTTFTALCCICSPFTTTIDGNLPLLRASNKLSKDGSVLAGYGAWEQFDDVGGVVVDAGELFPKGSVILHGIKAFDQKRIDEAILDAASVICEHKGILSDIFLEIIGNREEILKEVDNLVYEDGMGLSAWVSGKRVLIGNRELMHNHSIDTPSKDYERKYVKDGREILYLSNSGELTAMFVLSYHGKEEIAQELKALRRRKVALSVHTVDPNITAEKIEEVYGFPESSIRMMPAKVHDEYYRRVQPKSRMRSELVYFGTLQHKLRLICDIFKVRGAVLLGMIMQTVGVLVGLLISVVFVLAGSMGSMDFMTLLVYQTVWAVLVLILPSLRRY